MNGDVTFWYAVVVNADGKDEDEVFKNAECALSTMSRAEWESNLNYVDSEMNINEEEEE